MKLTSFRAIEKLEYLSCFLLYYYTYALNNPLKYTDPSGYQTYLSAGCLAYSNQGSGGGFDPSDNYWTLGGKGDFANSLDIFSDPTGGWWKSPTGDMVNRYTGQRMREGEYDARLEFQMRSAGYKRVLISKEGEINGEVAVFGSWKWISTGTSKMGPFLISGEDIIKIYLATLPVAISVEINGSSEVGWGASGSPIGGLLITRGADRFKFRSFTSLGVGGGFFGVSGQVVATNYYYLGNIGNFNMELFEGESLDGEFSFGEGLIGGAAVSIVQNPNYRGEFLIGIGGYIGLGAGAPVSWSVTWQNTYVH